MGKKGAACASFSSSLRGVIIISHKVISFRGVLGFLLTFHVRNKKKESKTKTEKKNKTTSKVL